MSEFNIDTCLDEFSPYLLSLRRVDGYRIVDVELPNNWDAGKISLELTKGNKKVQTVLTEQSEQSKVIAIVGSEESHSFVYLLDRLEKILRVNKEREEKNKLFKVTVKKLEKLFLDSNLDQLQKLVIDVDEEKEQEMELGNTDNVQIPMSEDINEESDDEVMAAISAKKTQISTEE